MSNNKYLFINNNKIEKYDNISKSNLKSLDYGMNENQNIIRFKKYNSNSIKNIFNTKKFNQNRNFDFPVKVNLKQKRNDTYKNNLIMLDNAFQKIKQLDRKISGKSIKNQNKSKKSNLLSLEPFSPKRILTIPTNNYHFGYSVDEKGDLELLDDPDIFDKFHGTKNNSIGPDRYNIKSSPRKKLIIDWSKNLESKNLEKSNFLHYINKNRVLTNKNDLFLTNILSNSQEKKKCNDKNRIPNINSQKLRSLRKEEDYKNKLLRYEMQTKEEQAYLGPGSYDLPDEFIISPKKNKFQNFGSSMSRKMESPKRMKLETIEDNIKYFFQVEKSKNNKKDNEDKVRLYKNSKFYIYKLKAELLKEKSIFNKKILSDNLGPGLYEPKKLKNKKESKVENFGTLVDRNLTNNNKNKKDSVCSYLPLEDWTKKFKKKSYDIKKKENIFPFFEEIQEEKMANKEEIFNKKDSENETDKENNINSKKINKNRPGFGSEEPRFYVFQSQINEFNGVGSYELNPIKKNKENCITFMSSDGRHKIIKYDNNPLLGPGTYDKYNTFFDWNKKSYNVKVKDRIELFKNMK